MVVTRRVDPERGKSAVNGESRMLMEVVDPEPLTGDHFPFRKETGKNEFMEGKRRVVVEKGRQCQSKEAFSGGRKSAGAEVPVRRSVSVNVTDAVTQSITDDVAMSRVQTIQGVLRVWKRQLQRDRVLLLGPRGCLSSERVLLNIELDVLRAGLANERTLYRRR